MLDEGALFYGETRRRVTVKLDAGLRALTETVAQSARQSIASGTTPPPVYEKRKCGACSLLELCQPKRLERRGSVEAWLHRRIEET